MRKNVIKILIVVVIILAMIIGVMYLIDSNKMKRGEEVVFSTWGTKYVPALKNNESESNNTISKNYQKYSKIIDNVKIELNIPNEWKYKEIPQNKDNNFYKYALKLYRNNEDQYAMLYFYNNPFGVCGTERTTENIVLSNGKEATIGYYDGNKNWSDISFYNINKNIAVLNYNLMNEDAKDVIEFIKTINII